jgi:hypothetical protein
MKKIPNLIIFFSTILFFTTLIISKLSVRIDQEIKVGTYNKGSEFYFNCGAILVDPGYEIEGYWIETTLKKPKEIFQSRHFCQYNQIDSVKCAAYQECIDWQKQVKAEEKEVRRKQRKLERHFKSIKCK